MWKDYWFMWQARIVFYDIIHLIWWCPTFFPKNTKPLINPNFYPSWFSIFLTLPYSFSSFFLYPSSVLLTLFLTFPPSCSILLSPSHSYLLFLTPAYSSSLLLTLSEMTSYTHTIHKILILLVITRKIVKEIVRATRK